MSGSEHFTLTDDAERPGWVTLALRGRATVVDAALLHHAARDLAARDASVRVDCGSAEYLDTAVLQVLISLGRELVRRGRQFDLANVPGPLGRVLCVAGLGSRS